MKIDYCTGLYFENKDELKRAKALLEQNGFEVDDVTSHMAVCIEEADFKLDSIDTLYDEDGNEEKITDAVIKGLAWEIYGTEYIDVDSVNYAFDRWLGNGSVE